MGPETREELRAVSDDLEALVREDQVRGGTGAGAGFRTLCTAQLRVRTLERVHTGEGSGWEGYKGYKRALPGGWLRALTGP